MASEAEQLRAAIGALEAQRALLGDAVADAALAPMRGRLATIAAAADPADAVQTLRQVTILFMDVVDSTALSHAVDAEDIAEIMDGFLAHCARLVRGAGGRVMSYAGDCLVAAFGADEAREDDAERAVRCGLALLDAGRDARDAVRARHGWDAFGVRVGIHTGGVLLGGGVEGDGTIRGEAMNIAARMEQAAPPGCLRISHDTYRMVRGVFDVEPQAPLKVKGVAGPMQTYLVECAKARAFRVATRGIEGVETRMIGRDAELQALQAAFRHVFATRTLTAVTVVGEAGLGKSRLLYEFSNWAEARPERFLMFQGRATPGTPDQPYGLLRDILAWRFRLADGDDMETAKAKLEQGLIPVFSPGDGAALAEAHAHLLGYLIGLDYADSRHVRGIRDDQQQVRNRAFHAMAELLRRITAQHGMPAVMALEDLHWADEPSLDFLSHLGQVARDVPLLIVGLTRPALFERRAEWIGALPHARVDLATLGKGLSRELANELLKKLPEVPSALRELVSGGAEGNPFYMEELVKMLIDQRAIDASGEVWTLDADRLLAARVPPTLTGVLQARLDGLPAAERRALQDASVIGLVFWDQALGALNPGAPNTLSALERRELALPRPDAALAGMREYAFKHQILHQVTYETVLKRSRREAHGRAAAWFAALRDARAADFLSVAAQHFAQAGDDAAACEYFARAAEHARARSANALALDLVDKALHLLPGAPEPAREALRWRLLNARERTFDVQGRRDQQLADLDALTAIADLSGDARRQADIAWRRAHRAMRMGDFTAQREAARASLVLAEQAADGERRLQALRLLAGATGILGDVPAGRAMADEGLAQARTLGLGGLEAGFLNTIAILADLAGDAAGLLGYNQQGLRIAQTLGDRRLEMVARANLATHWVRVGEASRATDEAGQALSLSRALGERMFEGFASGLLSEAALLSGADAQALTHATTALAIAVETQARDKEIEALVCVGEAELALGRLDAAAASFARGLAVADPLPGYAREPLAGLARVALARGDHAAALRHLAPMLAELDDNGALDGAEHPHLIRLTCWRALAGAGDSRAGAMLARAHAALDGTGSHPVHRAIASAWAARP